MDLHLYGFVRPESGEVFWLILPTVNVELFSMALNEFAKEVGARTSASCWWWIGLGGTQEGRLSSPKGYILSSYPRAPRSLCRQRGCGRCLTRLWQTGSLRR